VTSARTILLAAEQVHVIAGARDQPFPGIPAVLHEHQHRTKFHPILIGSGRFGQRLLEKVHELDIDLLIMGACLHHPLHDLIFGGVTSYMLAHADIPLLMHN